MIKDPLIECLVEVPENGIDFIVNRQNKYVVIHSKKFRFLDISQFLAPGCSYARYLETYECEMRKGVFPYEWLDDLKKLKQDHLPSRESFYSELKQQGITEEEYDKCKKVWRDNGMKTMKDYLM